jgi:hypothetical protein
MKKLLKKLAFFVLLLLVILVNFVSISHAKKQPAFRIKIEKEILNYPPKLGDVLEVIFAVSSPFDLDDTHFMVFALSGAELISIDPIGFSVREETDQGYLRKRNIKKWLWFKTKAHEKKAFRLRAKIDDYVPDPSTGKIFMLDISVGVESWTEEHRGGEGSYTMQLFLVDKQKGILGTHDEVKKDQTIEYRYDGVDGTFYAPGELDVPVNVKWNLEIIQMIRELEPALSDSEALLLHSDHYKIGIPQDAVHWDKDKKCWITNEKKIFEIFLKDGWYNALKTGKRNAWIETEKKKIKGQIKRQKARSKAKICF